MSQADNATLQAAHSQLTQRLAKAFGPVRKSKGDVTAYGMALLAVGDFLVASGGASGHAYRFAELASALDDHRSGIKTPLLSAPSWGSAAAPSIQWARRSCIATGMRILIKKLGFTRKQAADEAVDAVREIGVTTETVLSWYDELLKGRVKNAHAKSVFRKGCATIEKGDAASLSDADWRRLAEKWFEYASLASSP